MADTTIKKYNSTNQQWEDVNPQTTHTQIVASGTPNATNYLAGNGTWKAPLYYVEGNTTGTAGTWTGTISNLSAYYDGLTIRYKQGIAGATNVYLNINNIGNAQVYRYGGARLTTHWPVGTIATLTYNSSDNRWYATPDYNSTDDYRMRWQGDVEVGTLMHGYQIIMEGADRKFHPVTEGGSTANTNTVSTVDFLVGGTILYHYSSNNQDVGSTGIGYEVYESGQFSSMEYFNNRDSGWATTRYPFYFKGTINSSGHFNLDNTSYTSWLTQTLPTSDDGFVYIQIGYMADDYDDFRLASEHPIYIYKDGALRLYPYFSEFNGGTVTSNVTISNSSPRLILTDTNNDSDFHIQNHNGVFTVGDTTNQEDRFEIDSSGNVDILSGDLTVLGSGGTIGSTGQITDAFLKVGTGLGIDPNQIFFTSTAYINSASTLSLGGGGNGTNADLYITADHKIGLGTTTPAEKLDVSGSIQANSNFKFKGSGGYYLYNSSMGFRGAFMDDGGQTKIFADGNGSTPVITLDSNNATFANDVTVQGDLTVSGETTTMNTTVSTTDQWTVTNAGTDIATIINQTGSADILDVRDDGTSVFKVKDGGGVEMTNHLKLAGNSSIAIGSNNSNSQVSGSPEAQLVLDGLHNNSYNLSTKLLIRGYDNDTARTIIKAQDENGLVDWTMTSGVNTPLMHFRGSLGIGRTADTAYKLDVNGDVRITGDIKLAGDPTTTNQGLMIDFTGFDKEGTTDFSDRAYIEHTTNFGGHSGSVLKISSRNDSSDGIAFDTHASSQLKHNGNTIWTAGNDGSGSGLDADTVDGKHAYQSQIKDTRNDGDVTPNDFADKTASFSFTDDIANSPNTWDSVLTMKGWTDNYRAWQLFSSSTSADTNENLYFRSGIGTSWGSVKRILTTADEGSGNGIDADTVDGKHIWSGNVWNRIPFVFSDGVMEVGRYIDFHNTSGDTSDFAVRLDTNGTSGLRINGSNILTTASTIDADTLDNLDSTQFLRSDIADTMTGNLSIENAGPQLTLKDTTDSDDINLSFTNSSNSQVANISTAGNRLNINTTFSNGLSIDADKVGIGTTSPSTKMHIVESGTTTALTVQNASSNGTVVKLTSTGDNRSLYLQTDHIYSNGALYIGDGSYNTIVRGNELLVETNVRTQGHLYLNYDNTATDSYVYFGDSASDTAHYLRLSHSGQRFQMSNTLDVSGAITSASNLYLNYDNSPTGTDAYIYFGDDTADSTHWLRFDNSAQQFGISNRLVGTAGRLGAIEYNGSDVDKVNFALNTTTQTLTITTS